MDVGRGAGSCNSDCDCPLCAPFCSTSGYCQNHQRAGRRKCTSDSASTSTEPVSACPPLLGDPAPPGCNKTFAGDGNIPCWDDTDCPSPGTCENNICNLFIPGPDCPNPPCRGSLGRTISYTRSDCNYLSRITDNSASLQSYQRSVHTEKYLPLLQPDDLSVLPTLQERREVLQTSL